MVAGVGKMVAGEGRMVAGEGRMVAGEGRMVAGEGRMVAGVGKMVAGEGKMVAGEGRMVAGEGMEGGKGPRGTLVAAGVDRRAVEHPQALGNHLKGKRCAHVTRGGQVKNSFTNDNNTKEYITTV